MANVCKICRHKDRSAIDMAIVEGGSDRTIAGQFGVTKSGVERHRKHVPEKLARAREATELASADDLLSEVRNLHTAALRILKTAEEAGDNRTALAAIRETRGVLELLAKVLGAIEERRKIEISGPDGGPVDFSRLPIEELERISTGGLSDAEVRQIVARYELEPPQRRSIPLPPRKGPPAAGRGA